MEDVNVTLLRLAFLALPGAIALRVYQTLTGYRSRKNWEDFFDLVIFSLFSYALLGFIKLLLSVAGVMERDSRTFLFMLWNPDSRIPWGEILCAVLIGILTAYGASYMRKYKLINRFGQRIGATNRVGDEDIWEFFHNSSAAGWVYVRDLRHGKVYYGWISHFSDSGKDRELILQEVIVYDKDTGQEVERIGTLYLSRASEDLTIEVPAAEMK